MTIELFNPQPAIQLYVYCHGRNKVFNYFIFASREDAIRNPTVFSCSSRITAISYLQLHRGFTTVLRRIEPWLSVVHTVKQRQYQTSPVAHYNEYSHYPLLSLYRGLWYSTPLHAINHRAGTSSDDVSSYSRTVLAHNQETNSIAAMSLVCNFNMVATPSLKNILSVETGMPVNVP